MRDDAQKGKHVQLVTLAPRTSSFMKIGNKPRTTFFMYGGSI